MRDNTEIRCEWCGVLIIPQAMGRRPKYCKHAHRQRAYEQRRMEAEYFRGLRDGINR